MFNCTNTTVNNTDMCDTSTGHGDAVKFWFGIGLILAASCISTLVFICMRHMTTSRAERRLNHVSESELQYEPPLLTGSTVSSASSVLLGQPIDWPSSASPSREKKEEYITIPGFSTTTVGR